LCILFHIHSFLIHVGYISKNQGFSILFDLLDCFQKSRIYHPCYSVVGFIREVLLTAANTSKAALESTTGVDDRGAASTLATALHNHITGGHVDIVTSVTRFFDRLFAAVYLHGSAAGVQPSTIDCVASVRRQRDGGASVPFSGVERAVSDDLTRSAQVARALVDSLRVAGVVARSLQSVDFGHQCSRALTRLRFCVACEGLSNPVPPRPCRQFCANVARGCLVHLVAGQPGLRWEHFIDAVNHLAVFGVKGRSDLEHVVTELPRRLSDEVTRLQNDIQNYNSEVRHQTRRCKNVEIKILKTLKK